MALPDGLFEERKAEIRAALGPVTKLPGYSGLDFSLTAFYPDQLPKLSVIVKVKDLGDKAPVSIEVARLLGPLNVIYGVEVEST